MARARTMEKLRDESGQTLVFVAFFMGLLALGFVAFALDVGALFREKRMAQSAAQAAAVAAAEEVGYGNTANEQAVANAMAKLNGFDTTLATNPATVTLTAPATGNFTGSYVQATVSMPIHTTFLGAFSAWDGYGASVGDGDRGGWNIHADVRVHDGKFQHHERLDAERDRLRGLRQLIELELDPDEWRLDAECFVSGRGIDGLVPGQHHRQRRSPSMCQQPTLCRG